MDVLKRKMIMIIALLLLASLLTAFTICIDPGHQEKANLSQEQIAPGSKETKAKVSIGTKGVSTGIPEYVFNLELSFILRDRLQEEGFNVFMTRERHDVDISNIERAEFANSVAADLCIRIHANYSSDPSLKGTMLLIPSSTATYTAPIYEESRRAAEKIMASLREIEGITSLGIRVREDMTGFNWSKVPVLIFEAGYMSNPEEDVLLASQDYREALVEAIVSGVVDYFLSRR
ncbi:MAG TPA: N-acetylmuramoyl-L-alanine amidase [Mesotoga infera]|nr:N-acetylmuramoyl-L-alanine amidase [Mesotoga infera]HOI64026.1 N-acetylmuramoyl-L-alanine amidase [Mesotoga sp.]HNS66988.1 N-acetylmuramoyl-L-alanine amidase [Mesotoga infera]HOI35064.1 N-acetylmuramoyl-L-alanine amidase [Mesotoga infera]HON27325.1 N-acetylmuramoyl-L-alanine amidase [Mesotoga infera]